MSQSAQRKQSTAKPSSTPGWVVVIGGIVALVVIFLLWGSQLAGSPEGRARAAERDAIAECRRQAGDDLQAPGTQRFVRGVCAQMEADFRRKWNRNP